MKSFYTIGLLIISNIFMTFAWYGHLKLKQESSWFASLPLIGVVTFSWSIAFFEYLFQIPANRIGFIDNGGPFSNAVKDNSRSDNPYYLYGIYYCTI